MLIPQHLPSRFDIVPMTEQHAIHICSWRYPEPYHVFNWRSWEELCYYHEMAADPLIREQQLRTVLLQDGSLAGFLQLFPLVGVTRLGFGLRPEYCGLGWGAEFIVQAVAYAREQHPTDEIDLEVHIWNERAIRVYQKVGFHITDTYMKPTLQGEVEVHCMVLEAPL
ncbi:GNAT family N-acetyltransferase [Paenibacillus turpanensis]|uniref:GNAT family N-acetyltransferase n=1 Tax=Paenibacillus turpanensis TaxID=2689078 RepID=UPI00140D7E75|nr:GNAT family N-acetyltransferase [Paenibacillus turpanensis]